MAQRKQRSDAQQNRERILVVAKVAFAKSGANASLDEVARQAGVGPGTLYRHFPSREELLKAVYQAAADKLATAASEFAETLPPPEALRAWMMLFVDYLSDKQIIAPALNALVDDPHKFYETSYGRIGKLFVVWSNVPSKAAISERTSMRSTSFGRLSASPAWAPVLTGSKAPRNW